MVQYIPYHHSQRCNMKILQIASRIPFPLDDGGAISVYHTTKSLHSAGHEVVLCALNTNKHYQPPSVMAEVCTRIATTDINTDISVFAALKNLFFSDLPYNLERFVSEEFVAMIVGILQAEHFDVVHIESTFVAYMIPALRMATTAPIVVRPQNIEYVITERLAHNASNPLKAWYYRLLTQRMKRFEIRAFPQADGLLTITPEDAERVRELGYTGEIAVMPAGVDTQFFSANAMITPQPQSIFYFGSLDWAPNIEAVHWFMAEVYPKLRKELPQVMVHIGGKNPSEDILRYGTMENVTVHGNVPSAPRFMNEYSMMIVPLLSGGGMRLKIVEAMGVGVPIISTKVGAEGIAGVHGENMLFAETPDEFIACIRQCCEDETLRQTLSVNARRTAEKLYSWDSVISRAIEFYRHLIQKKQSV